MTEGSFEGVEGVKIFTREWQPAGEPRGVVVISHGLNAHSGLYEWAAQQFTSNGLAVYALLAKAGLQPSTAEAKAQPATASR